MTSKSKKIILSIVIFWLLSTITRSIATSNYNFPYWFDLGRDAIVSREIIENKDLKIQGPSASGTNDTLYHGVLYYYLIGPLYTLFQGNPQYVMYGIIAFSSLGIIPFYLLTLSITKKESIANIAGVLFIASHELYKGATWLSNPVIATVSLPFFFYFFWEIFFKKNRKLLPFLLLSLAATHQAGILYAPWWGLVFIGFFIEYYQKNFSKWKIKTVLISIAAYLLGVASMIITQLKLMKAGIFTFSSLSGFSSMEHSESKEIVSIVFGQYYSKILASIFPSLPVITVLVFIYLIYFTNKHFSKEIKTFLIIIFASPLLLLSWHYRIAYHSFLILELLALLILAVIINNLWFDKTKKIVAIIISLIFIFSNVSAHNSYTEKRIGEYFVPQGAYLREQLDIIDYTYQVADGNEFSISTITNPYKYNTLWAYLYSWYGQEKYGYLPNWYGNDQSGMFGDNLLVKRNNPQVIHFSIREPNEGMHVWLYQAFEDEQNSVAIPSTTTLFGTIDVRLHTTQ